MTALAFLAVVLAPDRVAAEQSEPTFSYCDGVLHASEGQILFGGAVGEDEGICLVAEPDWEKVLSTCLVGRYCKVRGSVRYCEDAGECVEIRDVTGVSAKRKGK
jgi:hypothetical protein